VSAAARWFPYAGRADPGARLRVYCLPFAGGNAAAFWDWRGLAADAGVEVCPVQLPGRTSRMREPPFRETDAAVAALREAVSAHADRPFALCGHSMGALLAFELARALRDAGARGPEALFVSGRWAPELPDRGTPDPDAPEPALIAELRAMDGTPQEVLDSADLMRLVLPTVRADFALCRSYRYRPAPPLDVPIHAYGGRDDPLVPAADLAAWQGHTTRPGATRLFPGGHFFLLSDPAPLLADLDERLREIAARLGEAAPQPAPGARSR